MVATDRAGPGIATFAKAQFRNESRNFVEISSKLTTGPGFDPPDDTQIPSRGVSQFGKISGISKNVEKIELFFAMSRESAFASKWVGDHRPRSTAS